MFEKIKEALTAKMKPIKPVQGKRTEMEENSFGETVFTIQGKGYPGFFIIFGAMFGGIPSILLFSILFGTPSPDNTKWGTTFALLFLTPFFAIGISTFCAGIFLWLGKTRVKFTSGIVSRERSILGKVFQKKELDRKGLEVQFDVSHKENEKAHYKLKLESGGQDFTVGGTLREAELLWLERAFRKTLGEEVTDQPMNIASAIRANQEEDVNESEIDPDYQSKKLRFSKTTQGWEAHFQNGFGHSVFMIIFGSIFLLAGLLMEGSLWDYLTTNFEAARNIEESSTSSGGKPPALVYFLFGGIGALVMISGILSLGYRMTLAKRHSRIHLSKHLFGIGTRRVFETNEIEKLEVKTHGKVNDSPRFKLEIHLKGGKKVKLMGFAESDDVGQLKVRLEHEKVSIF